MIYFYALMLILVPLLIVCPFIVAGGLCASEQARQVRKTRPVTDAP